MCVGGSRALEAARRHGRLTGRCSTAVRSHRASRASPDPRRGAAGLNDLNSQCLTSQNAVTVALKLSTVIVHHGPQCFRTYFVEFGDLRRRPAGLVSYGPIGVPFAGPLLDSGRSELASLKEASVRPVSSTCDGERSPNRIRTLLVQPSSDRVR